MKFTVSIHIPLLRGDYPSVVWLHHQGGRLNILAFRECRDRDFHTGVMPYVGRMATEIAATLQQPFLDCHLVFSGRGYQPDGYHALLAGRWPAQSYSLVTMTIGEGHDRLEGSGSDKTLFYPNNHFVVPRLSIIGCLNLAYSEPGLVMISANRDQLHGVEQQLAEFSERATKISANDPEAMLEYKGEGMVVAWGVGLWHAFRADVLRNEWGQKWLQGDVSKVLAST